MIGQTNIEAFYSQCTDSNTAIMQAADLKKKLEEVKEFDWEEFNKPIHEMDIKKLAESLKNSDMAGNWKPRKSKNDKQSSKQASKQAIQTYTLQKSTVAGIGSGKSGAAFLIRGTKSKFASHAFNFGSQEE
jgi:hypothetical protein